MEKWLKISLLLSLFGFLKEIRPSEPFVYEYLSGKWTNMTAQEVNEDVFTVGTYVNTSLVVVAFLVTELLRYKPLIVACGIFGVIVWSMLIWTPTLLMMQLMEIFFGAFMSCDVAYFTYMYAKVDEEHYPKVTSNARMAYLLGKFTSGVSSQLLTSYEIMDYKQLNYITLVAMVLATITSLFLPSVKESIYFQHEDDKKLTKCEQSKKALHLMYGLFKDSFSKDMVINWSIILAVAACGFCMVENYIQTLWNEINKTDHIALKNGFVVSAYTLIGVVGSYFAGYFRINWSKRCFFLILVYFITVGGLIILTSQTNSVYVSYAIYAVLGGSYHFIVTVAYSEISQRILRDSYGLVLGINTFVGLILQSIITTVVIKALHFHIRDQYVIFGLWHIVFFCLYAIYEVLSKLFCNKDKLYGVRN